MKLDVARPVADFLLARTSRRGFLARATVAAAAMTVAPVDLLLKPGNAYGFICECVPGTGCDCTSMCCDGYTQFCCTINNGINGCPPGTFAGGWWKADGSAYCAGPRYYIDCMGECQGCGCGGGNFCPTCDNLTCECALGSCDNRHVGCTEFRYGQCHQEIACTGRIACRVVSCTPPWLLDPTCSTVAQTDESTADHYAPCQDGPQTPSPLVVGIAATPTGKGYWLADAAGGVAVFGDAVSYGSMYGTELNRPIAGIAATSTGKGYWLVASDAGIFSFGDATFDGSTGKIALNKPIVGMAADSKSGGYRFVAADGGVFDFAAPFYGSTGKVALNKPIVGMAATPDDAGYWLAASDGGVFSFGDANFYGSMGAVVLQRPVVGIAATPTGKGYWLVASDGGIFSFGDAAFYGSLSATSLLSPIVSVAVTPTGKGYWMVSESGEVYPFGDAATFGRNP